MKTGRHNDAFLEERLDRYDRWLAKKQIAYSSRVIPVVESLAAQKWVLPTEKALELLRPARTIAVQDCECRSHYRRCDHPLEVCLLLNTVADTLVARGDARPIDLAEAAAVLENANQSGLVHLSLYMPDHEMFALCSCCACCCHDLQIVRKYGRPDLMVRSDYVARTDPLACIDCGDCVERCAFDARLLSDDRLTFEANRCVGCGLCVTVCPVDATSMVQRDPEPR